MAREIAWDRTMKDHVHGPNSPHITLTYANRERGGLKTKISTPYGKVLVRIEVEPYVIKEDPEP